MGLAIASRRSMLMATNTYVEANVVTPCGAKTQLDNLKIKSYLNIEHMLIFDDVYIVAMITKLKHYWLQLQHFSRNIILYGLVSHACNTCVMFYVYYTCRTCALHMYLLHMYYTCIIYKDNILHAIGCATSY